MKQLTMTMLLASSLVTLSAYATPVNQTAIAAAPSTVAQALKLKDNTPVSLKGKITKSLGDEKYEFRDGTGVITVDIDDELWHGKPLAANATVTIHGEIDVDYTPKKRTEIDVDHIVF